MMDLTTIEVGDGGKADVRVRAHAACGSGEAGATSRAISMARASTRQLMSMTWSRATTRSKS